MQKTCERCRALQMGQGQQPSCNLGYEIDRLTIAPLDSCPKPLTYLDLIEAREEALATLRKK